MKILKHGNAYKETECPNCKALLAYTDNDVKETDCSEEVLFTWHHIFRQYIICPECKKEINLIFEIDGEKQKIS
jgi:uncharacterized protein YbaR (Trm112 family)